MGIITFSSYLYLKFFFRVPFLFFICFFFSFSEMKPKTALLAVVIVFLVQEAFSTRLNLIKTMTRNRRSAISANVRQNEYCGDCKTTTNTWSERANCYETCDWQAIRQDHFKKRIGHQYRKNKLLNHFISK